MASQITAVQDASEAGAGEAGAGEAGAGGAGVEAGEAMPELAPPSPPPVSRRRLLVEPDPTDPWYEPSGSDIMRHSSTLEQVGQSAHGFSTCLLTPQGFSCT